jgi:REP element-mobilizing transposase RayT
MRVMARSIRIEVAGGWYHVTARGNERREVFRDQKDYFRGQTRTLYMFGRRAAAVAVSQGSAGLT